MTELASDAREGAMRGGGQRGGAAREAGARGRATDGGVDGLLDGKGAVRGERAGSVTIRIPGAPGKPDGRRAVTGVVFDMDGLMFDTQVVWDRLWTPALAPYGLAPNPDFIREMRGTTGNATFAGLRRHFGDDVPAAQIYDDLRSLAAAEFVEHPAPAKPGLFTLLERLRALDVPRAVASSSPRAMILANLRTSGAAAYFDDADVVCGQDVARSKPAPDIFLEAARRLGSDPASTVVLEDSFPGVRAGAAGGFVTIMVPDLQQPDDEIRALATCVCPSLTEVAALLGAPDASGTRGVGVRGTEGAEDGTACGAGR